MLTRRHMMLGVAALTVPLPAIAAPDYRLAPDEIADGVWLIPGAQDSITRANGGAICNIVMLATSDGAVVVDTGGTFRHGTALRAFAEQRLGGVAAVINTHHHPDHWFGNQAFADRPIMALPASRAAQAAGGQALTDGLYRILGSWMNGTAPVPALQDAATGDVTIGGRHLHLLPMAGHTQADLVITDTATGTLIAGDMLFLDRAPSFPDARIAEWRAGLAELAQMQVSGTVPGHGPYHRDSRAVAQTLAYLNAFQARLDMAATMGLAPAEALAAGPAPEFAGLGANPEEYHRAVVQRWADFENSALPVIGGSV